MLKLTAKAATCTTAEEARVLNNNAPSGGDEKRIYEAHYLHKY